ncbi:MAG TPA: hypothetical protein PLH29_00345 [bacterium]|nr:hypothetical protein [bacterium]
MEKKTRVFILRKNLKIKEVRMGGKTTTQRKNKQETKEGNKEVCPHCNKEIETIRPGWGSPRKECGCTRRFRMYFND